MTSSLSLLPHDTVNIALFQLVRLLPLTVRFLLRTEVRNLHCIIIMYMMILFWLGPPGTFQCSLGLGLAWSVSVSVLVLHVSLTVLITSLVVDTEPMLVLCFGLLINSHSRHLIQFISYHIIYIFITELT